MLFAWVDLGIMELDRQAPPLKFLRLRELLIWAFLAIQERENGPHHPAIAAAPSHFGSSRCISKAQATGYLLQHAAHFHSPSGSLSTAAHLKHHSAGHWSASLSLPAVAPSHRSTSSVWA